MLSKEDRADILQQFQYRIPTLQIVREYGIANPPVLEQHCLDLPDVDAIPMLKTLCRMEAGRIACMGVESYGELDRFLEVLECCRKHGWLDDGEIDCVLVVVGRWVDANRNGEVGKISESEAAIMRVAAGLSNKMF